MSVITFWQNYEKIRKKWKKYFRTLGAPGFGRIFDWSIALIWSFWLMFDRLFVYCDRLFVVWYWSSERWFDIEEVNRAVACCTWKIEGGKRAKRQVCLEVWEFWTRVTRFKGGKEMRQQKPRKTIENRDLESSRFEALATRTWRTRLTGHVGWFWEFFYVVRDQFLFPSRSQTLWNAYFYMIHNSILCQVVWTAISEVSLCWIDQINPSTKKNRLKCLTKSLFDPDCFHDKRLYRWSMTLVESMSMTDVHLTYPRWFYFEICLFDWSFAE